MITNNIFWLSGYILYKYKAKPYLYSSLFKINRKIKSLIYTWPFWSKAKKYIPNLILNCRYTEGQPAERDVYSNFFYQGQILFFVGVYMGRKFFLWGRFTAKGRIFFAHPLSTFLLQRHKRHDEGQLGNLIISKTKTRVGGCPLHPQ